MDVKLHKPSEVPADASSMDGVHRPTIPRLSVSGLVITRAALIEAMRIFVPNLADIEVVEDGERFLLSLARRSSAIEGDR